MRQIAALYPMWRSSMSSDNARYHHAKLVQEGLREPERIKLHSPGLLPHLNPIERLWGLMHRNVTHNKCYGNGGTVKLRVMAP